jgi:hypothetical protein
MPVSRWPAVKCLPDRKADGPGKSIVPGGARGLQNRSKSSVSAALRVENPQIAASRTNGLQAVGKTSPASRRPARGRLLPADPLLRRATFKTSRLIEFCSEKELIAQTGHQGRGLAAGDREGDRRQRARRHLRGAPSRAPVIDFSPASDATLVIPRGTPALPPLSPIPRADVSSALPPARADISLAARPRVGIDPHLDLRCDLAPHRHRPHCRQVL